MKNSSSALNIPKKIIYLDYLRILACLGVFACHLWVGSILPLISETTTALKTLSPECLGVHGDALYKCTWQTLFIFPNNSLNNILLNGFNLIFGLGYQGVHLFFYSVVLV